MKTLVFECDHCYIETIMKYDSEMCDPPRYCPHCGTEQLEDYEELGFDDD